VEILLLPHLIYLYIDAASARNNKLFKGVCEKHYALGDPGFQLCDYIVAGLKANMTKSKNHYRFYVRSKSDQITIEHVNSFIKNFRSIQGVFRHDRSLLSG